MMEDLYNTETLVLPAETKDDHRGAHKYAVKAGVGESIRSTATDIPGYSTHVPGRRLKGAADAVIATQAMEKNYSWKLFQRAVGGSKLDLYSDRAREIEIENAKRWLIMPHSHFRAAWDGFSLVLIFINIIMVPFWVAFGVDDEAGWMVLDIIIDIWFAVDILLNFRTAYIDDGELVVDSWRIARHYLRTYLVLDFVATFPFSAILNKVVAATASRYAELPTLLRMVRLVRLIKIVRLLKAKRNFSALAEMGNIAKTLMRVIYLAFWMTTIGHVLGCFWALVNIMEDSDEGWTEIYGVDQGDTQAMYLSSLYFTFATLTTVGYGDVSARTNAERVYAVGLMLTGAVLFATIVGKISALAASMNRQSALHQETQDNLAEFMRERQVPKPLRKKLRTYFGLRMEKTLASAERDIVADLSPALRRQVLMHLNHNLIRSVPFLRHAELGFVNDIVTKLNTVHCIPKDYIILAGEVGTVMYLLKKGDVDIISRGGYLMKVLHQGSFFGEIACITDSRRTVSVRARTSCELLALSKKDLLEAVVAYPSFKQGLQIVANARKSHKQPEKMPGFRSEAHRVSSPPPGYHSWPEVFRGNAAFHARAMQLAGDMLETEPDQEVTRKASDIIEMNASMGVEGFIDDSRYDEDGPPSPNMRPSSPMSNNSKQSMVKEVNTASDLHLVPPDDGRVNSLERRMRSLETAMEKLTQAVLANGGR